MKCSKCHKEATKKIHLEGGFLPCCDSYDCNLLLRFELIKRQINNDMQDIFNEMLSNEKPPEELAKEMNLIQLSDSEFLDPIVDEIIANNPDEVQRYKDGKKQLMGFFVGQAMKASKGKANPKLVTEMVTKKLQSDS